MPTVDRMTPGQLKLHYGAMCQRHQVEGAAAISWASLVPPEHLRAALLSYEAWAGERDWKRAEDALLSIVDEAKAIVESHERTQI